MSRIAVVALACIISGAASGAPAPAAAPSQDPVADLNTMYAEFWEENLQLNPLLATQAGDPRYNAELPNYLAPEYIDRLHAFQQKYLDRAHAIVGTRGEKVLSGQDRLSYESRSWPSRPLEPMARARARYFWWKARVCASYSGVRKFGSSAL